MDKTQTKWTKEKQAAYYKEWRKKNKEKISEYQKKWHEENRDKTKQYLEDNKEYISEKSKKYREENKEYLKELWKEWYKKNKERSPKRRFTEAKNAAKKRNIEWKLLFEEYIKLIETPCYYCNNELGPPVKRSIGLDRLDSNGCYELNNVVSCCYKCNTLKSNIFTPEETKMAVETILNYRKSLIVKS